MKQGIFPDDAILPKTGSALRAGAGQILRRSGKWVQWTVFLCAMFATPALGCLNDTSVDRGEQEFKSQYNLPVQPVVQQTAGLNPWSLAALSVGGGLATGSLIVAVGRQRRATK